MLANFLSKSKPINFIILLIFFFCFYLLTVLNAFYIDGFDIDKLLKSGVLLVLFISIFFFYNFIVSKNRLTFDNSYAIFLFMLFLCFILSNTLEYKALILLILHLLFLRKIYSLKSKKQVLQKIFDAGFLLGVSFIIEPLSIIFFILMYAGIFIHQKTTIHTILIPIVGFISPLILYFVYLFWFDKTEDFFNLFNFLDINVFLIYTGNNIIWFVGFVLLLTLLSLFIKSPKALSVSNSFKRNWILLNINLVIALVFAMLIIDKNGSEIVYLLFPTSIIIANGVEIVKSNIAKNVVFILILVGVITHQFLL